MIYSIGSREREGMLSQRTRSTAKLAQSEVHCTLCKFTELAGFQNAEQLPASCILIVTAAFQIGNDSGATTIFQAEACTGGEAFLFMARSEENTGSPLDSNPCAFIQELTRISFNPSQRGSLTLSIRQEPTILDMISCRVPDQLWLAFPQKELRLKDVQTY